jgi:predicted amidohydrolase
MRVAACQLSSTADKDSNLGAAMAALDQAAASGADLAVLPECVEYMGTPEGAKAIVEPIDGPSGKMFSDKARQKHMWILAGSIRASHEADGRTYNTSMLFNRDGRRVAVYRKLHLYDVEIPGCVSAKESAVFAGGNEIVNADIDGVNVGLSICYDLRFPELYRLLALRGAKVLLVPAAFTSYTGRDHWELLLRARAVENQCFVVAADQIGSYAPGKASYGRSMIIDPWGTVLACAPDCNDIITADLNLAALDRIRQELPALANRRPDVYTLTATGPQQLSIAHPTDAHPANGHPAVHQHLKGDIPMAGLPEEVAHPDFTAMGIDNPPTIQHELDHVDMHSAEVTDR